MSFLILVRHGQSIWNLEGRFTGWVDVDLTKQGKLEAETAGILIKDKNIEINHLYSSLQLRANNTLKIIQGVLDNQDNFTKAWQLNERHYGALTGLNKVEMSKKIGEEKVLEFRRSWDVKPEPLNKESPYHPINIQTYKQLSKEIIPDYLVKPKITSCSKPSTSILIKSGASLFSSQTESKVIIFLSILLKDSFSKICTYPKFSSEK